jgi:hypothetical protein
MGAGDLRKRLSQFGRNLHAFVLHRCEFGGSIRCPHLTPPSLEWCDRH